MSCSPRSTAGSPKASTPRICRTRRRCSTNWGEPATGSCRDPARISAPLAGHIIYGCARNGSSNIRPIAHAVPAHPRLHRCATDGRDKPHRHQDKSWTENALAEATIASTPWLAGAARASHSNQHCNASQARTPARTPPRPMIRRRRSPPPTAASARASPAGTGRRAAGR